MMPQVTETTSRDCLFCSMVSGAAPVDPVLDTEEVLAFPDIAPHAPTHVLVVPKVHYPDISALAEADPGLTGRLVAAATSVAASLGLDGGFRLLTNNGADAGQTVAHVHLHVLGGRPLGTGMG